MYSSTKRVGTKLYAQNLIKQSSSKWTLQNRCLHRQFVAISDDDSRDSHLARVQQREKTPFPGSTRVIYPSTLSIEAGAWWNVGRHHRRRCLSNSAAAVDDESSGNQAHETLFEKSASLCDLTLFPAGTFCASEELTEEAVVVLQELTKSGSEKSSRRAFRLFNRLASEDAIQDEALLRDLLRLCVKNWVSPITRVFSVNMFANRELHQYKQIMAPDATSCAMMVLQSCATSNRRLGVDTGERLIRELWTTMKTTAFSDEADLQRFDEHANNLVIQFKICGGHVVEALQMTRQLCNSSSFRIHEETFLAIIIAAAKSNDNTERREIGAFLSWAGEQYKNNGRIDIKIESIALFASALLQNKPHTEVAATEWVLNKIDWIGRNIDASVNPSIEHYEKAIQAFANAGDAFMAKALLDRMFLLLKQGNTEVAPTVECCNIVLKSLSMTQGQQNIGIAANATWNQMTELLAPLQITPNHASYNFAICCWAGSGHTEAPKEITRLIYEMGAVSKERWSHRQPDPRLFQYVLSALSRTSYAHFDQCLEWLEEEARAGNDATILEMKNFIFLMSGQLLPSEKMMAIFARLKKVQLDGFLASPPSCENYNMLLRALKKSGSSDEMKKKLTEQVLLDFEESSVAKNTPVTYNIYSRVLQSYVRTGDAQKAEETLMRLYEVHEDVEPNVNNFNQVLMAWLNSEAPRATERADAIVEHMGLLHGVKLRNSKPNIQTYELLIKYWKRSHLERANDRLERARDQLKQLLQGH